MKEVNLIGLGKAWVMNARLITEKHFLKNKEIKNSQFNENK